MSLTKINYWKKAVCVCVLGSICGFASGQQIGFDFQQDVKSVQIPFERHNNLIVIPVTINNTLKLKFILDTGVQFAILTEKAFGEYLNLTYDRELVIQGPGTVDSIRAQVVRGVSLRLPGVNSGTNQSLLVLDEDYLKLKRNLGAEVYGIIGYDIFSRFVVEVNNDHNMLILHEPRSYRPRKSYTRIPMQIINTKPYIQAALTFSGEIRKEMNLMVDSGASHALLLDDSSDSIFLPEKRLETVVGRGLGGSITGYLGRINSFEIEKFAFSNVIASFPLEEHYTYTLKSGSRHGTIGGEILTRFNPIFDYFNEVLYVRKSGEFFEDFEHDMSGLALISEGDQFEKVKVVGVKAGSPADLANIKVNDYLVSINGMDVENLKFSAVSTMLRHKPGKRVNLRLNRQGTMIRVAIKLERMI
ncbi:MAG: aspartyl protease family protein [Cyclobacteriaceae bacterium]